MDLQTLTTALLGSGVGAGAVVFLAKRLFERSFDAKIKLIEEKALQSIREQSRRQAAIYDEQFQALRTAMSLVYRARNSARDLSVPASQDQRTENSAQLTAYHKAIRELL